MTEKYRPPYRMNEYRRFLRSEWIRFAVEPPLGFAFCTGAHKPVRFGGVCEGTQPSLFLELGFEAADSGAQVCRSRFRRSVGPGRRRHDA